MARRTIEQVDAEARAEFALQLEVRATPLTDEVWGKVEQAALEAERLAEWKRHNPTVRVLKRPSDIALQLGADDDAIKRPYVERANARYKEVVAKHEAAEARMHELAPDIILHHQPDGRTWIEVERVSDSCYSNQTQSKHYSQVSAELRADGYRKHATVRVVERDRYFVTEAALQDELEVEVLKRLPGLTLRCWLKRCMQLGANPRVYQPFLPHGTEERMGLDHFGNDVGVKR